jgi:nucleoside-diphosphate-sugar epimerase
MRRVQAGGAPRVVVTGASGFVGGAVVAALAGRDPTALVGARVVALVRAAPARPLVGVSYAVAPRWDAAALEAALPDAAAIVHCASVVHRPGLPEAAYRAFNVDGTRALLAAAERRGARHLVFLSSIKVHGEHAARIDEATPLAPEAPYARAKAEAEGLVAAAPIPSATLRLCPVYGRGDKGNVRAMIRAIAARRFFVPGDGATRKSLVHVSTVAAAVGAALGRGARGVLVVADPAAPSIRELADAIAAALGRRRPPSVPAWALLAAAGLVERACRLARVPPVATRELVAKTLLPSVCDPARARAELGIDLHVDLGAAIRDEVAWLRGA